VAWVEAYPSTKCHLDPCSRLAAARGPKLGVLSPPPWGRAGFPSNTMSPGPRSTSAPSGTLIHPAVWPQQTWTENWGLFPLFGEGKLDPHLKQCGLAEAYLHCTPSFILIHPIVWLQYANVTDRQDRTDRQRSDSIGRTVLQAVAQKVVKHGPSNCRM